MCDVPALEVLWLGLDAGDQERGVGGDPYPVESQHDRDQHASEDQHWPPVASMIGKFARM
jgi:hypothetical protein